MAGAGNPNVYNMASQGLQGAMSGTAAGMNFQAPMMQAAPRISGGSVGAGTAFGGINKYMNPYTQQVIDTSMADLERQRQMQQQQIGAQARSAGAFGGSRHGVAEALSNEAFAQQGGQLASGLRQQGFSTALGASQQDVANQLAASTATASNQLQANLANQQMAQQAALQNQQAALEAARMRMSGASQLGNLANLGFGFGQQIGQQQMQQGAMQQSMLQQLINAAKNQYAGFTGSPQQSLQLPLAALGGLGNMGQTSSRQPGLFDYLALGATAFSDIRLKQNVQLIGKLGGVQFYTWDWNDEGKRIADPKQPTFGVMADEVAISHPQHVMRGDDGYLRVNYGNLIRELEAA